MQTLSTHTIGVHTISTNDIYKLIVVDNSIIKFTPTEYQLVICLLSGKVTSDETLIDAAPGNQGFLDQALKDNLQKHINNIRSKIRPYQLHILRVHRYGYLLAETEYHSSDNI